MATAQLQAGASPTWSARFREWVGVGTLLKTAIGLLIGAAGAVYGVYQHFAKASELRALREEQIALVRGLSCDLASQAYISGQLGEANQRIRTALSDLKRVRNLDDLPNVISDAVAGVDQALAKVAEERDRVQRKKIVIGGPQCGA